MTVKQVARVTAKVLIVGILLNLWQLVIVDARADGSDLYSDFRFYGSLRPVIQYSNPIEGQTELDAAQYSSRIGIAAFQEFKNQYLMKIT